MFLCIVFLAGLVFQIKGTALEAAIEHGDTEFQAAAKALAGRGEFPELQSKYTPPALIALPSDGLCLCVQATRPGHPRL